MALPFILAAGSWRLLPSFTHTVTERLLRYVVIDTQSDPASPTCPPPRSKRISAACWLRNCSRSDFPTRISTSTATSTRPFPPTPTRVPVDLLLLAHGHIAGLHRQDVKPQIVSNYRGGDIVLPADPPSHPFADHPALADQIGNDIVTTDGTTLLGADNKAGLAEIMDAAQFLVANPRSTRRDQAPVHAG